MSLKATLEIVVPMSIDVDGAPKCYGPKGYDTLDNELNAHEGAKASGKIVGYLTRNDDGVNPVVQGPGDPAPGYYVSATAYHDHKNTRETDPLRYVDASKIAYTVLAHAASQAGVVQGDFCVVYSRIHKKPVYAIVGDSGHASGAEGSLALLQLLGYKVKDGRSGGEDDPNIVVRYFKGTNPNRLFFHSQSDLEKAAAALNLDTHF